MLSLSCQHFADCVCINGTYTCDVSDGNYFFDECETLLIRSKNTTPANIHECIKDLHFVYEVNGVEVTGENLSVEFTERPNEQFDRWFDCTIKRPECLIIDPSNIKSSATKIKLVFTSDYTFHAQFFVNANYERNYKQPNSTFNPNFLTKNNQGSGCVIL